MSTTFKIDTVAVAADPIRLSWEAIRTAVVSHHGVKTLSKFRNALLTFNTLTSAQFNEWASRCDNATAYVIYMPERVDAAYIANPETWHSTLFDFDTVYQFHFVGARHSVGVYVYDAQILVYMCRAQNSVVPPGG